MHAFAQPQAEKRNLPTLKPDGSKFLVITDHRMASRRGGLDPLMSTSHPWSKPMISLGSGGVDLPTRGLGIRESGSPYLFIRRDSFLLTRRHSANRLRITPT